MLVLFSYPRHCVDLFLDFVNIFRELMVILGMNEVSVSQWRHPLAATAVNESCSSDWNAQT